MNAERRPEDVCQERTAARAPPLLSFQELEFILNTRTGNMTATETPGCLRCQLYLLAFSVWVWITSADDHFSQINMTWISANRFLWPSIPKKAPMGILCYRCDASPDIPPSLPSLFPPHLHYPQDCGTSNVTSRKAVFPLYDLVRHPYSLQRRGSLQQETRAGSASHDLRQSGPSPGLL